MMSAATQLYPAKVTTSAPLSGLFSRGKSARQTKIQAGVVAPFASKSCENLNDKHKNTISNEKKPNYTDYTDHFGHCPLYWQRSQPDVAHRNDMGRRRKRCGGRRRERS